MKPFILASLLSLALLAGLLIVSGSQRDDGPVSMHGVRMNHARYHGSSGETVTFDVLLNDATSFYGYEEAMTAHHLVGPEDQDERLAMDLKSLKRTSIKDGVRLALEYSLPFETDSSHIHYDPAHLRITYREEQTATIPVGTFSYHFDEDGSHSPHIGYEKITVMSDTTPAGASAAGVCITFRSLIDDDVVIEGVDPATPALRGNMDHLTAHEGEVTPFTPLETVTNAPFNPAAPSVNPKTATLSGGSKDTLCVPFIRRNRLISESFPFIITYRLGEKTHTLFIDDVRYIRNAEGAHAGFEEAARATLEAD